MPTVVKRSGDKVEFNIANVSKRLRTLVELRKLKVDVDKLLEEVTELPLADGSGTNDIDTLITMVALGNSFDHPDYAMLSGMVEMTALRKRTADAFDAYVELAAAYVNPVNKKPSPALAQWFVEYVRANKEALNSAIVQDRDLGFNLFAMKTLEKSYLIRLGTTIVERPQYMYMRMAVKLGHKHGLDRVLRLYEDLSTGMYSHASPTMFSAGTPMDQLSSCFKLRMKGDSIEGIYDTLKLCAMISKTGGGIGLSVSDIRASGSHIAGTGGTSNGLVPMLRVYNNCFPEDHEILTATGYMSYTDVMNYFKTNSTLDVACHVQGSLEYHPVSVDDVSVDIGVHKHIDMHKDHTGVSILPTENHRMWLKVGDTYAPDKRYPECVGRWKKEPRYENMAASDVFDSVRGNESTSIQFLSRFSKGLKFFIADDDLPFTHALGLFDADQINAFIELFGYWLGDGWLEGHNARVAFGPVKAHDVDYIVSLIERIGLPQTETISVDKTGYWKAKNLTKSGQRNIYITGNKWWSFFASEYGKKYKGARARTHAPDMIDTVKGEKWMPEWALKLNLEKGRTLLKGLRFADGDQANSDVNKNGGIIFTSSTRFRDQVVQLATHAGYSTLVRITSNPGDVNGSNKHGKDIVASTTAWSIAYTDGPRVSEPKMRGDNLAEKTIDGRVWCLTVPTDEHLIMVRRPLDNIDGSTGTSTRPVIVGNTARYVDQGGNKRPGAFACFLEPWHADVFEVVSMRVPTNSKATHTSGTDEDKGLDLNYGIWTCDEFMRRVEADEDWTLMCPAECPGLVEAYGDEFTALYRKYEAEGRGKRVVKAWDLFVHIVKTQIETGEPYFLYKDAANLKSNQKNVGPIVCSNLCVVGETKLLTPIGHIDISKLEGQRVTVWNGEEWVDNVPVGRTSKKDEDRPVITVVNSHGLSIDCTPEHKFVLADGETKVAASELSVGTKLFQPKEVVYEGLPLVDGDGKPIEKPTNEELHDAWYQGYISGRLIEVGGRQQINLNLRETLKCPWLKVEKKETELLKRLNYDPDAEVPGVERLDPDDVALFAFIPVPEGKQRAVYPFTANKMLRAAWCGGFKDAIGHLDFAASTREALMPALLMLRSVGFRVKIAPEDGSGNGIYCVAEVKEGEPFTVTQIIDRGRKAATYCVTEPKKHRATFNGMCTGQCTEMMMHSSPDEISVCVLGSIVLPKFIKDNAVDYAKLIEYAGELTINLNGVIDDQNYVSHEMSNSNLRHRPIGIGVQGLADTFAMLGLPFTSAEARRINKLIFEAIYYGFLLMSCQMAEARGAPYETFAGSPLSKGEFQFDLWGVGPPEESTLDWPGLKARILKHGVLNSLGIAVMPTASTAQILGNHEQCTPFLGNVYQRKVLGGVFTVVNPHLVADLEAIGMWTQPVREQLVAHRGSIQGIQEIPPKIKETFKTVWELKQRDLVEMQAERAPYIDHSQSFVPYMAEPTIIKVSSLHMLTWKLGLKTGMYYLRTRAASTAIQFTVKKDVATDVMDRAIQENKDAEAGYCSLTNREACLSCSA